MAGVDPSSIRERSLRDAETLGAAISPVLPLIDGGSRPRTLDRIVDRVLCLNAVCAASFGFERSAALEWATQEGVRSALSPEETRFLEGSSPEAWVFHAEVEAIWALLWAVGIVDELDFSESCSDGMVSMTTQ